MRLLLRTILFFFIATSWARLIIAFFLRLGLFGLLIVEAFDTSFLYMPLITELLLIALISNDDTNLLWVLYVIMAALGSVVGVFMLDLLMRKAGEKGLERFVKPEKLERLRSKLKKHAGWAIFVAAMMPPAFPFRVVVLAASALQSPRAKMLLGVFAGRAVRFTCEAIVILYFGKQLLRYLNSDAFEYVIYALTLAAIVGSFLTLRKWIGGRHKDNSRDSSTLNQQPSR
jgi:membrane protein YqaA with SNARE-associated domain